VRQFTDRVIVIATNVALLALILLQPNGMKW